MPFHRPAFSFASRPHAAVRALAAAALGLAALAAAAQPLAPPAGDIDLNDHGRGAAMAIGGGLKPDNAAVWRRLVALAGGKGARFVVLGTASEDPMGSAREAVRTLNRYGARAVALRVSPLLADAPIAQAVRDPAVLARVRAARGVFFTGGAQARIVDHLYPGGKATPLLEAIWAVYRAGGVVAGTSAGAAIMSSTMFRDAPSVLDALRDELRDGHEVDRGLGFVGTTLFVDQHFLKRGRFGRMIPLMRARGYAVGLGIEENSAAVVRGDEAEIVGGKAMLVDLDDAQSDPAVGAFNLRGARLSLLDDGDRVRIATRTVLPSAAKRAGQLLDPAAPGYKPYYDHAPFYVDMFADGAIANAMATLIDGRFDEVGGIAFDPRAPRDAAHADLGFAFRLYKGAGSLGWYTEAKGGEDYTVRGLYLDVAPVRMARPLYQPWAR